MKKYLLVSLVLFFSLDLIAQDCSDLFISEYVEGPGNNNGVEIYNPSSSTFDLSAYTINRYGNGANSSPDVWPLSGSIGPGQTVTVGNGQLDSVWVSTYWSLPVDANFYNSCDLHGSGIYPTPFYFNGDDAITLEKDGSIIDIFGKVGEDPGAAWTDDVTAGYTDANGGTWWTKRQTLIRKSSVKKGVTQNPILFNPTLEWDSLPDATYSELGNHNCDCIGSSTELIDLSSSSFVVYPNPAKKGENIIINSRVDMSSVVVSDLLGKVSPLKVTNKRTMIIVTEDLSLGVYLLKVNLVDGNYLEQKFIIE